MEEKVVEFDKVIAETVGAVDSAATQLQGIDQSLIPAAEAISRGRPQALAESAHKVGEVVTLINDIACQTNLLALTATIAAARAGAAGRDFAAVVTEVKTLVTQTARATEEIAVQIRAVHEWAARSAEAIESITQSMKRANDISTAAASPSANSEPERPSTAP